MANFQARPSSCWRNSASREISLKPSCPLEPGKVFQIGWAYLQGPDQKPVATMGTILAAVLLLAFLETTKTAFWDGALTPFLERWRC